MEVFKLNFDASISNIGISIAYIIRDSHGVLIHAGGKLISQTSIPSVELTVIWNGIKIFLLYLRVNVLFVDGDSLTVIRWMTKNYTNYLAVNSLLQDILS